MQLYHIKAEYAYRVYNIIISAHSTELAIKSVGEYIRNWTGSEYRYKVEYLGETESEIFYEI